jgi:hypothetical protein
VIAAMAIGVYTGGDRLSLIGERAVALFGFLLCASCAASLFWCALRAMAGGRYKPMKQRRGKRTKGWPARR